MPKRAGNRERAVPPESAACNERAATAESTKDEERADKAESAVVEERAELTESAEPAELPLFRMGYPDIEVPDHPLWDAQQANWPNHLRHEAWKELAVIANARKQPWTSSADHPAFSPDYAPNYLATPEEVPVEPPPPPGTKERR